VGKQLLLVIITLVLVSAFILGGCAQQATAPTTTKTLDLGGIAMLTGPASQGGLAVKQGWTLIVDKYNAAGD